jgi:hypothetical protein
MAVRIEPLNNDPAPTIQQTIQSTDGPDPIKIQRCFMVIIFVTMATNFDSGAVPAILDTMRRCALLGSHCWVCTSCVLKQSACAATPYCLPCD